MILNLFAIAKAGTLFGGDDPTKYTWNDVFLKVLQVIAELLKFASVLASIFILYAAFLYMTSAGNEEKAGQAKKTLFWAIVGTAIIVLSFYLVSLTMNAFGFEKIPEMPKTK